MPKRPLPGGVSRRTLLGWAAATTIGAGMLLTGCAPQEQVLLPSGSRPLPIPPLAPSTTRDGTRHFRLTAERGTSRLIVGRPEVTTPTAGYNGAMLGPTVRARRGERIHVTLANDLDQTTTLHWHGMHLPAAMDGGPHTPIAAGTSRSVDWEVRQPAATLWYHPHPHGETERQVLDGMAGLVILDDDASDASGLPSEYGVDDIPLILQDRFLDADGAIVLEDGGGALGTIGNTFLANGISGTHLEVATELVRLRILNGCTARFLDLCFSDDRPFSLIATDGGLLESPVTTDHLVLSPAERAEILVAMKPDERVALRTRKPELAGVLAAASTDDMLPGDFVELRAASRLRPAVAWALPADGREPLRASASSVTRRFELKMPTLNGRTMDMERIDHVSRLGATEIWEIVTPDAFPHNFHVHDVQFRILDIDGARPPAHLDGWKDTIPVLPGQRTRIILRFEDYADDAVPYMMHCHLLRHEDGGMMGQFLVTEDGTGPDRIGDMGGGVHHGH